ncbi:succinate--CoA ligase subunit alpha [Candidatus Sumerlaeota bacterium]|nr:succinate--CoA ligase subunit alpha [Candidatus Sumerlaeota bacterium]
MSIIVNEKTKLIVQGISGNEGKFHTAQMIDSGTTVVGGVVPGRGGETVLERPIYNTVHDAVREVQPNASIIFVPAAFAPDAALESIDAGISTVIIITEGIPVLDMMKVYWEAKRRGTRVIGPNCPGIISPGKAKIGIMPAHIHRPGRVGVISRSGTLTYEIVNELTINGYGQSTCIGIGGDPIIGTNFMDALGLFQADPDTDAVIMIGEIGGTDEETAAAFIAEKMNKPVVGYIAGLTAPPGKRMGHAGAIISGGKGTAAEKIAALRTAGIGVAERPDQAVNLLKAKNIQPTAK